MYWTVAELEQGLGLSLLIPRLFRDPQKNPFSSTIPTPFAKVSTLAHGPFRSCPLSAAFKMRVWTKKFHKCIQLFWNLSRHSFSCFYLVSVIYNVRCSKNVFLFQSQHRPLTFQLIFSQNSRWVLCLDTNENDFFNVRTNFRNRTRYRGSFKVKLQVFSWGLLCYYVKRNPPTSRRNSSKLFDFAKFWLLGLQGCQVHFWHYFDSEFKSVVHGGGVQTNSLFITWYISNIEFLGSPNLFWIPIIITVSSEL